MRDKLDWYYRKNINWNISKETAEILANKIMKIIEGVKYE